LCNTHTNNSKACSIVQMEKTLACKTQELTRTEVWVRVDTLHTEVCVCVDTLHREVGVCVCVCEHVYNFSLLGQRLLEPGFHFFRYNPNNKARNVCVWVCVCEHIYNFSLLGQRLSRTSPNPMCGSILIHFGQVLTPS
jgi:hypothetical protein